MRVVAEHKAVVSDVVHGVTRLHHGAKSHEFHDVFLFLALDFAEQVVERVGNVGLCALGAHFVAEFGHEAAQFLELFGIGHVVNAVRQHFRLFALGDNGHVFGHRAVGQQHEFFH